MTAIPEMTLFEDDGLTTLEAQLLSAGSAALFDQYDAAPAANGTQSMADDACENLYLSPR